MLFEDRLDSSQESVNGSCVLRHGHVGAIRTSDCANSLLRNDAQQSQPLTVAPNPQTHLMRPHSSLSGHHWDSKSEPKASSVRNTLTRTRQCLRQQERCLNSDHGTTRSLLFRGFFRKPEVARFDQRGELGRGSPASEGRRSPLWIGRWAGLLPARRAPSRQG
jgi:hypothetical protein